jgi:hypothetical protein
MLTLKDGPCEGTYMCKRAPLYLRAVINADGKTDVLDLIEDTPQLDEKIYIYEREGDVGSVHLNYGGGRGGFYAFATYHHLPDVIGENARDNKTWQKWATERGRVSLLRSTEK